MNSSQKRKTITIRVDVLDLKCINKPKKRDKHQLFGVEEKNGVCALLTADGV